MKTIQMKTMVIGIQNNLFPILHKKFLFIWIVWLARVCPIMGQTLQKQPLTPKDYKLWSTLQSPQISDNGEWYSYVLSYEQQADTLFVASTKKTKKYNFPIGSRGQFSPGGHWFGCLVVGKGMALLDLKNGNIKWVSRTNKFEFSTNGRYLICYGKSGETKKGMSSLLVKDLSQGTQESYIGVKEYLLNPKHDSFAYIEDKAGIKSVKVRHFGRSFSNTPIVQNKRYPYKNLCWNGQGTTLAFLQELPAGKQQQKRNRIYYNEKIDQNRDKLHELELAMDSSTLPEMDITDYLRLSDDGQKVFFKVQSRNDLDKLKGVFWDNKVQLWGANDRRIYPKQKKDRWRDYGPRLACWWPKKDRTMLLQTKKNPDIALTGNQKYMLSYDHWKSRPILDEAGAIDIYLTDLDSGQCSLFLKEQEDERGRTQVSPSGRYICYFRNKQWWVYDLEKKNHTNVSKGMKMPLYDLDYDRSGALQPYGSPGWAKGDKKMIIYDQYDVWLVSPEGKTVQRLTKGRETQKTFRIYKRAYGYAGGSWFPKFEGNEFDLSHGLVFKVLGKDKSSGYYLWKPGEQLKKLVYKGMHVQGLKKSRKGEAYIYSEESFETPPRLCYWEKGMSHPKILEETNPQQRHFQWGHSELLEYTGPEGQPLQGALFYPTGFDHGKKYPMIVNIYERQSYYLHHYINPSQYSEVGFNPTNYTSNGYLVFYPDIRYKLNDPGISALKCIEKGIMAVKGKGIVKTKHIGLNGHSFGGYETTFIVSRTNLFATAVAGSSITDLVGFYHSIDWDFKRSQMLMFEAGQFRFKDSFYESPESYFINSPLHNAKRINTPLLLWTGGNDYHVDWHQSVELYLGLRRLDKECELLVYPDEPHALTKPQNQTDLSKRMMDWFDKYLKG